MPDPLEINLDLYNPENKPENTSPLKDLKSSTYYGNASDFGKSSYDNPNISNLDLESGDYKYIRGEKQPGLIQLGAGILRAGGKATIEALKTPAYLYSLGEWTAKNAAGENFTLDKALDNVVLNKLQNVDDSFKEKLAPVYQSYQAGKGSFLEQVFTTSFIANEGADGVGYLIGMLAPGAALKAAGMASKVAKIGGIIGKQASNIELGTQTLINTSVEALAESKGVIERLQNEGVDPSKIADAARETFVSNMGVLLIPNLIMNKNLLGRFNKEKGLLDNFKDASGNLVSDPVTKNKMLREYAKAIGINTLSEGFVEEGGQTSIENYEVNKAKGLTNNNWVRGVASEYLNTLSTIEGKKSILLGGLLGSIAGVVGKFKENKAEKEYYPTISKMIKDNFNGFSVDNDIYKRDNEGIIQTDPITNEPVLDNEKTVNALTNYLLENKIAQEKDLAALSNDKTLHDKIVDEQFTRYAIPFIQQGEVGMEILNDHIDQASNTQFLINEQNLAGSKQLNFEENTYKSQLKQKAKKLEKLYNDTKNIVSNNMSFLTNLEGDKTKLPEYINTIANTMFQENSKQIFYADKIKELSNEIFQIQTSASKDLPQNELIIKDLSKQIESLNKLLDISKDSYKSLFDLKEHQKAFNNFLKEKNRVSEEIIKATKEQEEKEKQVKEEISNEITNKEQITPIETLKPKEVSLDNLIGNEEVEEVEKPIALNTSNQEIVSKSLNTNTSDNTKGLEQNTIDYQAINNTNLLDKGINLRNNVVMMKLFNHSIKDDYFKFDRDSEGYISINNTSNLDIEELNKIQVGDNIKLILVSLSDEQFKSFESDKIKSLKNKFVKESDFDNNHIGIYSNDKLIGFVQQPHPAKTEKIPKIVNGKVISVVQNKTESEKIRKELIEYRKYILNKLHKGEEVTESIIEKGNGNLYTKLKPNGYIDATRKVLTDFRTKDVKEDTLLFTFHNGEKLILPQSRLTDIETSKIEEVLNSYNNFGTKGQIFQLVRDLKDSWGLVPVYSTLINDLTVDKIIDVLSTINDSTPLKDIIESLNDYIYTSSYKGANLTLSKDGEITKFSINGNEYSLSDILTSPSSNEAFKQDLKSKRQNISINKINNKSHQGDLKERDTLITNVLEYKGEYFIQPYIEYSHNLSTKLESKEPTEEEKLSLNVPQGNTNISTESDIITKAFGEFDPNEPLDDINALSRTKFKGELNRKNIDKWLKSNLPQLSISDITNIIDLKTNLIDAYGLYKDLNIYLFEGSTDKTAYHEAFHGVFRNILNLQEKEGILKEAIDRYPMPLIEDLKTLQEGLSKEYTNKQLKYLYYEEKLADDFAEFTKNYNNSTISQKIRYLFNKILSYFNLFTNSNKDIIDDLFEKVNTKYFKTRSIVKTSKNESIEIFNKPFEVFNDEYAYSKKLDAIFGVTGKSELTKKIGNQFLSYYQEELYRSGSPKALYIYQKIQNKYIDFIKKAAEDKLANKVVNERDVKYAQLVGYYFSQISKEVEKYLSYRNIIVNGDLIDRSQGLVEEEIADSEEIPTLRSQTTKGLEEATSISGIRSASTRMKMFLSSIPVVDIEGNETKDIFDITQFYDFSKIYYYIETHLTGLNTFDDQIEHLQLLSENRPEIKSVISKLTNKNSLISKEEFELLQNDFKTNFTKQQLAYSLVKFDTDAVTGSVKYKIIDANRESLGLVIRNQWESNLRDSTRKTISDINTNTGEVLTFGTQKAQDLLEQWKVISSKKELNSDIVNKILNKAGIELSTEVLNSLVKSNNNTFKGNVTDVLSWYASKTHLNLEKSGRRALGKLVNYEVTQIFNSYTSSFNNVENKNIYTIQLPSYASKLLDTISTDKRSRFEDLLDNLRKDPFYKYSNILQDLDSNEEYRRKIFKMSYLDGLKDDKGESKGSKFTSMTPKDYMSMEVALFQNSLINDQKIVGNKIGKYVYITPSDKSMAMIFDSNIYSTVIESKNFDLLENSDIVTKFYNIYLSEKARILHNLDIKNDLIDKKKQSKYKIKDLLQYYHVSKKNWNEFESLVEREFNNTLVESDYKSLDKILDGQAFNYNYFSDTFNKLALNEKTTKESIRKQITTELKQEIQAIKDEMLDKNLISMKDGLYIPISLEIKGSTSEEIDINIKQLIATYATNTRLFNIEMSNLLNGDYALYKPNDLQKRTYQSQSMFSNGNWNNKTAKIIVKKDIILPSESGLEDYMQVNVTDAQMHWTPKFYKEFLIANGRWGKEYDEAYDIAEGITTPKEIKESLRVLLGAAKPFLFGNRFDERLGIQRFEQVKCAVLPLFKVYTDINPLLKAKREEMESKGVDMLTYESAFKASIGYRSAITNSNDVILELNTNNIGVQVDNPEHILEAENDSLRQLKMLLLGSIDPTKTYKGREGKSIIDEIMKMESSNIRQSLNELDKHIDVKSNTSFTNFVKDMVTKRGATSNIEEILSIEDSDFIYPLDNGSLSNQIENMISSIFTTKVIKQPFDVGGSGVQASSLGLKFRNLKEQQSNLTESELLIQQELKWIKPIGDSISYAECAMPAWSKHFFNELGYLKDLETIPEKLRQLIMYRIPTEGLHSMLPIKVVKFLPETLGNFILLPYEITDQFGADFDFDKMYFIGREFYNNRKLNQLESYKWTDDIKERYNQFKEYAFTNKLEVPEYEIFKNLSEDEQIVRAIRNNVIIDNYLHLLTSMENYKLMITKSGFIELSTIKDKYFKDYGKYSFFSSRSQRDYKDRNHTGIALKGQSALHVSGHSYAVLMPLSTEYISNDGYLDRTRTVNFNNLSSTFNKLLDSNNKEQPFNKLYSPDGTLIADKLSSIMAAILDDIKNPILSSLGINKHTIDVLATIIRSGHNMSTAVKFVAQPGIKELSKLLDTNYNKIKSLGQEWKNGSDIIQGYVYLMNININKLESEIKDNPIFKDLIDEAKEPKSFNITDNELEYYLENFSKKKHLEASSDEEKAKYYAFQIRCLKSFDNYSKIATELVDMNKIFSINKEIGPNIENIIAKKELLTLIEGDNRLFSGFNISLIPTLKATYDAQMSALDFFEEYFPYSTEYYMDIKRTLISNQSNLDLSKVKVEDKTFINSFIRTYSDYKFDKFSNIISEKEKLFVSLPNVLKQITNPFYKDKTIGNTSYDKIRNNLFITELKVKEDLINGISNIMLKGNRLDLQVKNNVIEAFKALYNNEDTKQFTIDLIEHSFASTGFYTGLNSYAGLIPPTILKELGYMDYRFNLIQDLNYDDEQLTSIDKERIIDQMIRNNPKPFTKVFDDTMFIEYNSTKQLPRVITTTPNLLGARIKEILLDSKKDKYVSYIRIFDKTLGRTVLYKNRPGSGIYDRINLLGKKGFMIEVDPFEDIKVSFIKSNNIEKGIKPNSEDNTESEDEIQQPILEKEELSLDTLYENINEIEPENPFGDAQGPTQEDLDNLPNDITPC